MKAVLFFCVFVCLSRLAEGHGPMSDAGAAFTAVQHFYLLARMLYSLYSMLFLVAWCATAVPIKQALPNQLESVAGIFLRATTCDCAEPKKRSRVPPPMRWFPGTCGYPPPFPPM